MVERGTNTMRKSMVFAILWIALMVLFSSPLCAQDVILANSSSTHLKKGNHAPDWEKKLKKKKESKNKKKTTLKKEEKKKIKKKIKKQHKKNIKQKQKRKHKNQK